MPGRRPKPTAIKELEGNPGHRPLNTLEPKPPRVAPEMPRGLTKAARREWAIIVPLLLELGVLSNVDGKALAAYCEAYGMWEWARKEIKKYGLLIQTRYLDHNGKLVLGDLKPNPAVNIAAAQLKLMKSFLIEFGLTPASRVKLKIEKKPQEDPMEAFMNKSKEAAPLFFDTGKKPGAAVLPAVPDSATGFEA